MRTFVILLLNLVLGYLACSSAAARISDEMDHRRWTTSDQGPSSVGALAQTADGYLWLGTHDSLYRFDGFDFEKFEPADGEPLGVVSALLSTTDGLWVGFRAGGARLISTNGVIQPVDPGLPGGVVYDMAEDPQGHVWAATGGGLVRHDGTGWHLAGKESGFLDRHARAVHVDADGYVWAASEEAIYMLPPGASAFTEIGIKSQSISEIVSSSAGDIWITDRARKHLLRLKKTGHAGIKVEEIPASRSVSIVLDEQGDAWLGTLGSGVHYLAAGQRPSSAEDQGTINSYTTRDGLSSDNILAQLIDRDGTLWVGTDAGLDRLKRTTMPPLALPVEAGSHALAVSGDGSLWIGSGNGQLMGLRGDSRSTFELDMPITTLVNSQQHGLLIGGDRGIFSLSDDGPMRIAPLPVESASEAAVRAMTVGKDGDIWVSVNRVGLFVWADQQWRYIESVSDSERQVMPVSASRDLAGKLWFGYRDNLLVSFDDQEIERWGDEEGLNIGHVTAMLHLPGRTWVGGQHGLAYLKDGRFHRLDLPAAGPFQSIYGLVAVPAEKNASESGMDIWVHSRGGIFKLPAEEIERVIADGDTLLYSSHDHIGQLPMDPYKVLPLPTAAYTPEGLLWFATESGVVRVDPYQLRGMAQSPVVMIKSLTADGAELDISAATVRLSAVPKKLIITYSALNLAAPETMRFQYRLNGHDAEWVDAGRSRQAVFPRLRPGNYEFQVRALGENESFILPDAALAVVIPQVFYLRPGFLLVFSGTLLALALWMSRLYTRREKAALRTRLEERFQERERIARELHDTLLQSVQGMMLSFQAVADSLPRESRAHQSMERALDRAEQVIAEGRDRITGLRGQMAPTEDLAVAFQALPLDVGPPSSVAYSASNMGEPVPLRNDVRDAFYQVGREAVLNALRHAQASQVAVSFKYAAGTFEMLVVDDGMGIEPLYQRMQGRPEHGGLRGMYERAERIGATLAIISNARNGTRVSLSLPGSVAYEHAVYSKQNRSSSAG
ncbi:sensor histidine kinase [Halomonas citrativorans]|uniref:Histidine kinase n=1 Tax=Halomonas citrativorans TaxID=2742612 RepID=A0ABR9F704_9GAMM|nr:sensor histidine kinase [Halomonas citrativorans]MBE0402258.1 histidine kinase [Halomonas citrativorans]